MRRIGPTVGRYFAPQAALNLLLSVALVQRFGTLGVALGTLIPALALEYFFLTFVLRELRLTWSEFFARAVRPVAAPACASFLPLVLTYALSDRASLVLLPVAAACSLIFLFTLLNGLEPDERRFLVAQIPVAARQRLQLVRLDGGRVGLW
jgi:O-antigen/teichoic acid export membrane protein